MSGAFDEDTARTLNSGRETVGAMLSTAQTHLKKVFLVFVVGLLATIWALRAFVWDAFKRDLLYAKMDATTQQATQVVAVTPFDVILLQVKIGLAVGVLACIPPLVYYSRGALKQRGIWPDEAVPRWKIGAVGAAMVVLFASGVFYAYQLFFPIMFDFLAANAVNAGFSPTYSIVMWTQFIFFLTLSFGLAAQLPLGMSGSAAAGIVRYETFRDRWRYAVLGIFVFGAVFSPPDPFTQVMWGLPLVSLYVLSLGLTKLVVRSKQASEQVPVRAVARDRWNQLLGGFLLGAVGVYALLTRGGPAAANDLLARVGSGRRLPETVTLSGSEPAGAGVVAGLVGVVVAGLLLFYFRLVALDAVSGPVSDAETTAPETAASAGEPASIDIDALGAEAVRAAPVEAFAELSEAEALEHAERAMEEDPEKAELILERFDEAEAADVTTAEADGDADSDPFTSTAAGMADAFTAEETTEEDIGGYYYDLAFVLDSLTSKAIWVVGVFMVVLAGSFAYLYTGGIGEIRDSFLRGMPPALADQVSIVTLHPVEALIFEVKVSTLLAAVAVLPLLLYFAWPAVEERGLATGDRGVLLTWGGTLLVALVGGSLLGFFYIAPTVIGWLATDVLTSSMVIAYRVNNFGWLVVFTTIGVGVLANVPVAMLLFHRGGIVPYATMRRRWRGVVLAFFALGGFLSPNGVFTMFILAIPASAAYGLGLGFLAVYTRVTGTREPRAAGEAAD